MFSILCLTCFLFYVLHVFYFMSYTFPILCPLNSRRIRIRIWIQGSEQCSWLKDISIVNRWVIPSSLHSFLSSLILNSFRFYYSYSYSSSYAYSFSYTYSHTYSYSFSYPYSYTYCYSISCFDTPFFRYWYSGESTSSAFTNWIVEVADVAAPPKVIF